MIPSETPKRQNIKKTFHFLGIFFLLIAIAGPQWGIEMMEFDSATTQVIIVVDTSLSMSAEDLKPNRMHHAKQVLSLLLDQLAESRIGLIAFSGEAHIQCPLTTDREAAKTFLSAMDVGMVPQPGTAIGKAIALGIKMLKPYAGEKALVLLTDGEDQGSNPLAVAKEAKQNNIRIFPIGIGTSQGEPIPLRDESGKVIGFKKNKKGETILSKLGERDLIQIAELTGGVYFSGTQLDNAVHEVAKRISAMDRSKSHRLIHQYKNRFQIPLLLAILLLLIEMLLPEKKLTRIDHEFPQRGPLRKWTRMI